MFKNIGLALAASAILDPRLSMSQEDPLDWFGMSRLPSPVDYERQPSGKLRKNKAQRQARKANRKKK